MARRNIIAPIVLSDRHVGKALPAVRGTADEIDGCCVLALEEAVELRERVGKHLIAAQHDG
jgi:hypothetical protein